MDVSVVVPLFNEEESLVELIPWIDNVMKINNLHYEVVLIDDGSKDKSWDVITALSDKGFPIKAIRFQRNYGKSAALYCGFQEVAGDVVVTMDADLQDSPEEIPEMFKMIKEQGFDIVSGWKRNRHDPVLSKNLPSKFYNTIVRLTSGIKLHDFNCGLKAYKRKVVKTIEVYGEMHRYIPVIAKLAGFNKIGEKVVVHQKRKYGQTKFGMNRFVNGFLDLLTVFFISKFSKRPMHFFGLIGSVSFFAGFLILSYLTFMKFAYLQYKMTERPLFYFGLLTIIFGSQLFLTGFLAELSSRNSSERNKYLIEEKIN